MEPARQRKPVLTLRKKQETPSTPPTVESEAPQEYPEFTQEAPTAIECNDTEDDYSYYSERKRVRADKRTQRSVPTRKEARWQ